MADNKNNESKEVIKIDFQTNADSVSNEVDGLSASITKTEESTKKATKANKELTNSSNESAKATKDQAASFEDLGGGVGDAIAQVKGLGKQFLALLANPVVLFLTAVVGALALLYKAFASTNDGADKMEQVMAGVGATIDVLRDRILKVGGAIVKFFSGDFKGALAEGRAAVAGIGDEIAAEFQKAADATARLQEVEDAMRDLSVSRAKLNRDLVQSRELLQDENASYAQKKKALQEVGQAEQAQTAAELESAKKKLKAIQDLNALSDKSDEDFQKEADAQKAIFQLQEESARNQIKINKQNAAIDKEEQARKKAIAEERKRAAEEEKKNADFLTKFFEEQRKKEKEERDKADAEYKASLDANTKAQEEAFKKQKEQQEQALKDKAAADEARAKLEKSHQQALSDLGSASINAAKDLFGKNKAVQKAAIIADSSIALGKVAINTVEQVSADNVASPLTFGLPWSAVHIATGALGAASIVANTTKALQAVGGGSAPSAPATQTSPSGVSATPQTGFQASSENQIASSINNANRAPQIVKAFVVGSDVTDQQTLDAKLVGENSFGGNG